MAGEDSFKLLSLSGSLREHTRRERGGSLTRVGFLSLAETSIRSRFFPCLLEKTEQTVPLGGGGGLVLSDRLQVQLRDLGKLKPGLHPKP